MRRLARMCAIIGGLSTACFVAFHSIAQLAGSEVVAQDAPRVSAVCLDCHEEAHGLLSGTSHQILPDEMNGDNAAIACTDCHIGDERHWDEDPDEYPMTDLAASPTSVVGAICAGCHFNSHQQNMAERNAHANGGVKCIDCHQVHGSTQPALLTTSEPNLCYQCHEAERGQFNKPYRHPVEDGIVRCSECHMMTAEARRAPMWHRGTNAACVSCHGEFAGPFPYEHQATVDYSTEEGGCVTCHDPHGSYNPRMLRQPYESPHFNVCTQCHVVPKHNFNLQHGDRWAGVPCNECHVDLHGSYTSRLYFTPSLQAQGCINVGCHN